MRWRGAAVAAPSIVNTQTPNKGGRLLVGSAGGGAKDKLDPHAPDSNPDIARVFALYEPLAERNQNYEFKLVLAEEITGNAIADVWTVRLRQGVEFQNGKTLTSDDAIASIQRMIDPKRSSASSSLADIDPNGFKKLDDRTFSIQLKQPYGTFDVQLGQYIAQGSVRIDGEDLLRLLPGALRAKRGVTVSYVPQDPGTALNPAQRVGERIEEMLLVHDRCRGNAMNRNVFITCAVTDAGATTDKASTFRSRRSRSPPRR